MTMTRLHAVLRCATAWLAAFLVQTTSWATTDPAEGHLQPRLQVQLAHGSLVQALAWSPDSRTLASGGADNAVHQWNTESGRLIRRMVGHDAGVHAVTFSPEGQHLASLDEDGVAKVWDAVSGRPMASFGLSGSEKALQLSYLVDGSLLIIGSAGMHRRMSPSGALELLGAPQNLEGVKRVSHTPDGAIVALAADEGLGDLGAHLAVWHRDSKLFVALGARHTRTEFLLGMALSNDGQWLATSWSDYDSTRLELWNVRARRLVSSRMFGRDERVDWLAFDATGRLLGNKAQRLHLSHRSGLKRTVFMFGIPGLVASPVVSYEPAVQSLPDELARLSRDGTQLAVHSGPLIQIVSLATGASSTFEAPAIEVKGLAFRSLQRIRLAYDRKYANLDLDSRNQRRFNLGETILAIASDGRLAVTAQRGSAGTTIWLRELDSGKSLSIIGSTNGHGLSAVFSRDDKLVAIGEEFPSNIDSALARMGLTVFDTQSLAKVASIETKARRLLFSGDGQFVYFQRGAGDLKPNANLRWDFRAAAQPMESPTGGKRPIAVSNDGGRMALIRGPEVWLASGDGTIGIIALPAAGGKTDIRIWDAAFSPDDRALVTANSNGTLSLYSRFDAVSQAGDGQVRPVDHRLLSGHSDVVLAARFSPDGQWLVSTSKDQTTLIWNVATGAWVARLVLLEDGTWIVSDPAGRFDTNELESNPGLHWIMPDDPLRPVGIELFMREYYEPGLLPRLMAGELISPIRSIASINRVQPRVTFKSIRDDPASPGRLRVEVEVTNTQGSQAGREQAAGARDLAVFREGQRVAGIQGDLRIPPGQSRRFTFDSVQRYESDKPRMFTAYAFNSSLVKSETASQKHVPKGRIYGGPKPTIYLVSVGIDQSSGPFSNLRFAVADAQAIQQTLGRRLKDDNTNVVPVLLVAEQGAASTNATKADLRAVFRLLAGQAVDVEQRARIPNANRIMAAKPDDFLLFSFSGHGFNGENGRFYLVPANVVGQRLEASTMAQAISSDDLADWLKDVDAGAIAMILDACHSAAAMAGEGFKPGPMGSKGLGQLAYDKGIMILAAAQAADVALESDRFSHGLLTYALVREGIDDGRADFDPKDNELMLVEWLQWGVQRVPQLWQEATSGMLIGAKGVKVIQSSGERVRAGSAGGQRPTLFDHSRYDRVMR